MSEKTRRSEFVLKNGRSKKITDLTKLAVDSYPRNVKKSTGYFRRALQEAKLLSTEDEHIRNKTIFRCMFNLHIATVCLCNDKKELNASIEALRNLLPDAKKYDEGAVPDIHFYIGNAYLNCEECDSALDAFKEADLENQKLDQQTWPLQEDNNDHILTLESNEQERMKRLKDSIRLKQAEENECRDDSHIDRMGEIMWLTYKYFELKLKHNPEEAKEDANKMIHVDAFLEQKPNRKISPTLLCDLGLICAQLQRHMDARKCFIMARTLDKGNQQNDNWLQIVHNIAATLVLDNYFEEAVEEYIKVAESIGTAGAENQDLLLHVYLNWAFSYLRLHKTDKAYEYYTMAFEIALGLGDMQGVRKVLEGLIATVLSMEESVDTMERYKLKLSLLDCDEVDRKRATNAKKEIDSRRERFKKMLESYKTDTGSISSEATGTKTGILGGKRQTKKENGTEKKETPKESQERGKRANSKTKQMDEAGIKDGISADPKGAQNGNRLSKRPGSDVTTTSRTADATGDKENEYAAANKTSITSKRDDKDQYETSSNSVSAEGLQTKTSVNKSGEEENKRIVEDKENGQFVPEKSRTGLKKRDTGKEKLRSEVTEQIYKDKNIPKLYVISSDSNN